MSAGQTLKQNLYLHAVKLLSLRPHSSLELSQKLARVAARKTSSSWKRYNRPDVPEVSTDSAGLPPKEIANEVIHDLEHMKVLDDTAFAQWFCKQRQDFRPRSSYVLLSELFLRGIPREVASSVVDSHYDEEKACRDIACRKSRLSNEDLKLALLRKKFSLSLIDKVLADRKCVDPDGAVFVLESESDAETDVDGFDRENFH